MTFRSIRSQHSGGIRYEPESQCVFFQMIKRIITVIALSACLLECAARSVSKSMPSKDCVVTTARHCDAKSADAIVTAEVEVNENGEGQILRVVDVSPPNYPLLRKAVAQAKGQLFYGTTGVRQTIVDQFEFCERPLVEITAFGKCPPQKTLEERGLQKGYRVESVTVRP